MNKRMLNAALREFDDDLDSMVDFLYEVACDVYDWSWYRLSVESGLSYNTVARLGNRITRDPKLRTLWKLARSVGYKIIISDRNIRLRAA